MLLDLHQYESKTLDQVLAVLDEGMTELKGEVDAFLEIMHPQRVPDQYVDLLWQDLGLPPVVGISAQDRRAVLSAIGAATAFKGSQHALRLILRALWRFHTFSEVYEEIYTAVVDQSLATEAADWPAALTSLGRDQSELLRIMVDVELDLADAVEYGEEQAASYRQLLEDLSTDSSYENIVRTYRPGFDATPTTILGTSQFDGNGLLADADVLYSSNVSLSASAQAIFEALKWNVYPDIKIDRSEAMLEHFIPLISHIQYNVLGYKAADEIYHQNLDEFAGVVRDPEITVFNLFGTGSDDFEITVTDEFVYTADNVFDRDSTAWQ